MGILSQQHYYALGAAPERYDERPENPLLRRRPLEVLLSHTHYPTAEVSAQSFRFCHQSREQNALRVSAESDLLVIL